MARHGQATGDVHLRVRGRVLEVRLSNEGRANALTGPMLERLAGALSGDEVRAARVVLLAGEGDRHFSSGLDLSGAEPRELPTRLRAGERLLGTAARAIEESERPVVAVLAGAVMGGALELAMACDWRIAAPGARLGMPAGRLGVVYTAEGLDRFVSVLGPARTRRLFLTGAPIQGTEAFTLGLVDQLASSEGGLWETAEAAAAEVAATAPLSVAGARTVVSALAVGDRAGASERAAALRERAFASADFREGLAAFSERRAPDFRGE